MTILWPTCFYDVTTEMLLHHVVTTRCKVSGVITEWLHLTPGLRIAADSRPESTISCCLFPHSHSPECVCVLTETWLLTVNAKGPVCTHSVSAIRAPETRLTQTASVNVIAAGPIGTVTHTFTVLPKAAHGTLLTTPAEKQQSVTWSDNLVWWYIFMPLDAYVKMFYPAHFKV